MNAWAFNEDQLKEALDAWAEHEGQVVECGDHASLLSQHGVYARLYQEGKGRR